MATPDGWISEEDVNSYSNKGKLFGDDLPFYLLTTPEEWNNFNDDDAVDFERRLRAFLKYMSEHPKYRGAQARRFSYSQIYQRLYGVEPHAPNSWRHNTFREIVSYYSSRKMGDTTIKGKRHKRIYVLSYSRLKKRPWCLRLRMEWYREHGEEIEPGMLRLIHKKLEWGHARNPRTDANMEARREQARQRYREKYNTPEYREYLKERQAAQDDDNRRCVDEDTVGDDDPGCSQEGGE